MGTRKARPDVQRTAGVDAFDRMQAWGRELAARLDARGPVAKSAARIAADQCKSAGKARETALRLARAGDADCAAWQSRARELQARNNPYQYATAPFSDESLRAAWKEALVTGAAYPLGFRSPRNFDAALYAAGEALERAKDAANHAGRLEREWSPRVKESLETRQADTRKSAAVVGQAARWMIRLCAMAREQSPEFKGCRLRWQPILAKPLTLAQLEEHAVGFWRAYDPATAPAESADPGDTPAEEAIASPEPTVEPPEVAPVDSPRKVVGWNTVTVPAPGTPRPAPSPNGATYLPHVSPVSGPQVLVTHPDFAPRFVCGFNSLAFADLAAAQSWAEHDGTIPYRPGLTVPERMALVETDPEVAEEVPGNELTTIAGEIPADVAPTVAAVSAAVAELVPVRTLNTTRGGTSADLRRLRQGLTPQEYDRKRQEERSRSATPAPTPAPTPPAKSTGAGRKSRETPEQRDARIAAWREQNAAERERRRLAAAAEREQRREDWRRAHARPALRIVRSA